MVHFTVLIELSYACTSMVSLFYGTERNGTECSVALFYGTEQLLNISLHEDSSCLGL